MADRLNPKQQFLDGHYAVLCCKKDFLPGGFNGSTSDRKEIFYG
jgi:hypothetical protein